MHADWLLPQWPLPQGVRSVCSTRQGGISAAPFDSCNLGEHVGDAPLHVARNRQRLQQAIGAQPVFLNQVHGSRVVALDAAALRSSASGAPTADAALTRDVGLACTVMVADCLPVLLCSARGDLVAAAHAGWRGLAGQGGEGVLEAACAHFAAAGSGGAVGADVLAWLGPCIGPQAFEVGDEVRTAFVAHAAQAALMFHAHGQDKWLADLAGLARQRLQALGVRRIFGNDGSAAWCTVGNPSRFFSHRRDRSSGRFAAAIWRDGSTG